MAITSTDTKTILTKAFNKVDVIGKQTSELRCFKCGKRAYQSGSYIYCTSNITAHRMLNLDFIVEIANMYKAYSDSFENVPDTNGKQIV